MNWNPIFSKKTKNKRLKKADTTIEVTASKIIKCRNCETDFKGNFCPHCGQTIKEFDRPFSILIYDFMGTVFAFDARFFKTIKAVLFHPGKFSFEYMKGKRASYMKPFQFYVFVSFLFFLLLNIHTKSIIHFNQDTESMVQDTIKKDAINTDVELAGPTNIPNSDKQIMDSVSKMNKLKPSGFISLAEIEKAKTGIEKVLEKGGHTNTEQRILRNTIKMLSYPDVFISKLYKYFSWSFFIVMPLFAFWLWLFFHKTRKFYSSHFIYSLNLHATTFLIFTLIVAVKLIFPNKTISIENWLFWLIPIYIWLGMRKYYGRSKRQTTFKFLVLTFIYGFSITIIASFVFFISLYF